MNTASVPDDPAALAAIAIEVAEVAADFVRQRRPELFGASSDVVDPVSTKSTPTDPVTVADTEAETLIRSELTRRRPGDALLGEEEGGQIAPPTGVRWVVDPIDGTVNFLYGIPAFAISVAAQIDGVSVAGAVVDVAHRITYSAYLGGGAYATGRPADGSGSSEPIRLRCNAIDELSVALVATGFGYDAGRRRAQGELIGALLPQVRDIRRIGAAALDLCMVAAGMVDAHIEHGLSPWDWAAGSLIASEAGAYVRTPAPTSRAAAGDVTVACAPGVADQFAKVLADIGADEPIPVHSKS